MLIDTHCHLHFDAFDNDRDDVIARAEAAGVGTFVNVGTDPQTNAAAFELAAPRKNFYHTAGLHPHHSHEVSEVELQEIGRFVAERKPSAIGEIGLDYFKSEAAPETQKKAFEFMLDLAARHALPVIVHSRNAFQDTLAVLRAHRPPALGVMHCFSYDTNSLRQVLDLGFFASFTCNVTFKTAAALLEVARFIPADRVMLETDSPYLAPQILRGQRNEPANLAHLADFLAEKRGVSAEEFARQTTRNAIRLFRLPERPDAPS